MPNPITPIVKRFVPAQVLKILTIVTNILLKGREVTGAYSKKDGNLGDGGISGPR